LTEPGARWVSLRREPTATEGSVRDGPDLPGSVSAGEGRVRAAEVIAALSLATDLGIGVPLEHGLHSTMIGMRLCDRLGVDAETASQTYYGCLLFYVGCTAPADIGAEIFGTDDALTTYAYPTRFGSRSEAAMGMLRALAPPGGTPLARAIKVARGAPKLARGFTGVVTAICEIAEMLTDRVGLPVTFSRLFRYGGERWDGKGIPGRARREQIPLPVRIAHVARDVAFQRMLGGPEFAVGVVHERAGGAFDPIIAGRVAEDAGEILALDDEASAWTNVLGCEPSPHLTLEGEAIERALAAMGDFADLASPYLVGHSRSVAELAAAAARLCDFDDAEVRTTFRGALVHDLGRVAVPVRIWNKAGPLTADDWERVRLHAYHTERVLTRSPFLAALAPAAAFHHERLDGSGYHRGAAAAELARPARLIAAADAFHATTEPRPHRQARSPGEAAEILTENARGRRFDADAAAAVIEASGQRAPKIERPAGLTEREADVVRLLARGYQTKQVARALGISVKTADRHIQNAYAKIGVSTRAGATLFAMEQGLLAWGELPISPPTGRP
jgi:HD-GYP domain-containing protein (c-di-GMP phosphodiesterase class II)